MPVSAKVQYSLAYFTAKYFTPNTMMNHVVVRNYRTLCPTYGYRKIVFNLT